MIILNPPKVKSDGSHVIISTALVIDGKEEELWYQFSSKFKPYLVTENLDAFLVGILFLALKTGNNITLKAPVSAKLFYSLNHYLIPALILSNPNFYRIQIFAEKLYFEDLNTGKVAGTGMSCGIDSFATFYDHLGEKGPYEIKYFTYFNVGSHMGSGGEKGREIFKERLSRISSFSDEVNKELITVDSNLSEILKMNFRQTHTLRSISCVLHLQKLIRTYYYSSAYRFDHFELNKLDTSDSDILNLHLLSTESSQFFSSVSQYTRVERTQLVSENLETHKYLDVCTNPEDAEDFINCSKCIKCLRTQLTLELLGKLEDYIQVFDLNVYRKNKSKFFAHLLSSNSLIDKEIIKSVYENGNKIKWKAYYYLYQKKYQLKKKQLKRILKGT